MSKMESFSIFTSSGTIRWKQVTSRYKDGKYRTIGNSNPWYFTENFGCLRAHTNAHLHVYWFLELNSTWKFEEMCDRRLRIKHVYNIRWTLHACENGIRSFLQNFLIRLQLSSSRAQNIDHESYIYFVAYISHHKDTA